jgi:D-glycero-D-manno-heptose 1,7-bisphosphate phosphatase
MCGLSRQPAAFLDRDGTINVKAPEGEYITAPDQLRLLPGAAEAIRRLNETGALVIVVSNQRGIALGRMSPADLGAVHERLSELLEPAGARLDAVFVCPHDIGECDCRKPAIGMFEQAVERFPGIDIARSVMIGDSAGDVEAGEAFGVRTIRLGADARDLGEAVEMAIGEDLRRATV